MTAIILAGRTGAAYAAQLGTMRVNEEVDAIEILGCHPWSSWSCPGGGHYCHDPPVDPVCQCPWHIGRRAGVQRTRCHATQYWSEVQVALYPSHLVVGLVKAVLFGALVGIAGCRAGLNSGRNSEGVGKATTEAVVVAMVYLIIADALVNITCQLLDI